MDEVAVLGSLPSGPTAGKNLLIAVGILLVLGWWGWRRLPHPRRWFGRLPGDVRVERDGFRFYLPVTTAVLLSLLLSLVVSVVGWLWPYLGWMVSWFGRLPGDIRVEREGFTLWVPLASCLVLSVTIGTLVAIVRWFRERRR